jgi:hypothetical protein
VWHRAAGFHTFIKWAAQIRRGINLTAAMAVCSRPPGKGPSVRPAQAYAVP